MQVVIRTTLLIVLAVSVGLVGAATLAGGSVEQTQPASKVAKEDDEKADEKARSEAATETAPKQCATTDPSFNTLEDVYRSRMAVAALLAQTPQVPSKPASEVEWREAD